MFYRRIWLGVFLIVLLVGACYGIEHAAKNRGLNMATIIKMQLNNQTVAFMDVEALRRLDAAGPSLASVLAAAGIDRFGGLEIKGLHSGAVYRLNKGEPDPDLQLVFSVRGTVNLCNKQAKDAVLVEAVSEINAQN